MPKAVEGVLLLFALLLAACSSSKTVHDGDTVVPDGDVPIVDDAVEAEADDFIFIEADELLTDTDTVVCLSMKSYENVKAAGFPLKDGNGKITFCRPGCDTPNENDPQCARNIWDWQNWRHFQNYQQGINGNGYNYAECYPWPCILPKVKGQGVTYCPCDKDLTSTEFVADSGTLYDLKIEKGYIGIEMYNSVSMRTLLYDIDQDQFMTIAASGTSSAYKNERFIFYSTTNDPNIYLDEGLGNSYILSAKKNAASYRYDIIYDDEQHQAWFSRPPLVGEKWVVLNIEHRTTKKQEVLYSKVDEWNWHPLKYSKVYEGNIVDNRLTFIVGQREIYVCDLDKLPYDPATECTRIDRTGEMAYQPRLNEENKNQLVYYAGAGEYGLTLVDLSGSKPTYTLLPIQTTEANAQGLEPEQFKGNLISYMELFMPPNEETRKDVKSCFYRIDKKKQYCPTKPSFSDGRYDMGFNSFDGNYQLWKAPASINARFRDISCYCEKEGICPFEGLKK